MSNYNRDQLIEKQYELIAELAEIRKDAERYRWLISNSFDRDGATQINVWVHEWHPHSVSGESVEWKSRLYGPAIEMVIDEAIAATAPKEQGT